MYHDPELPAPRTVTAFPEHLKPIWLEALRRPEADVVCKAAFTVTVAHRAGMNGLGSAASPLLDALERADARPAVRQAAARALVELDARDRAARLFAAAQAGGHDLRAVIEPALARWDYRPARAVWLARLARPESAGNDLALAVRCLAAVREDKAAAGLRDMVLSRHTAGPLRLEAARALGSLRRSGLEEDARQLAEAGSHDVLTRLAAAALLRHHQGADAVRRLQELARDAEPAVAAAALARLVEIDPQAVVGDLRKLFASPDAGVRSAAVEVLFRLPTGEHIAQLADRFNDPHPAVRTLARRHAYELGRQKAHRDAVLNAGMRLLGEPDWRGQEQAIILLTQLDHKRAADRFETLLDADRSEVFVAAGWGLRRLAVRDTLGPVFEYVRRTREQLKNQQYVGHRTSLDAFDIQLCQLCQLLGKSRYRPADDLFQAMVERLRLTGKTAYLGEETRAAAVWALGFIHEGKPLPALVHALADPAPAGRLNDLGVPFRGDEDPRVRRMAALTLGRVKAKDALPSLRHFYPGRAGSEPVGNACGWAIEQITGDKMLPPAGPVTVSPPALTTWLNAIEEKK
jgi:HEAT repeat protein